MPKTANQEGYNKVYTEESLLKAIEEVKNGMPKREACRKYNVPRATLQFRFSDKFVKPRHGPSPILTSQEESILVHWIKESQKKGFPRRKEDIQISVKQFLDEAPRENPFKNNMPGDGWYKAFMKRHPELTTRKSEGVSAASSAINQHDIRKWFGGIYSYLEEKGYSEILKYPERIFNADETNFQLCPQNKRVIAPKGTKNIYEIESAKAKTTLTVLFTFSAAGTFTPPLIIYPGQRLRKEIADLIPEGFTFATSDTGWMKTEIFFEYVANSFHPHLKKAGIDFPVVLFVDGHRTHIDRKLSDLCTDLDIILISLYPNATRILQPADVSTFKPLKDGWRKGIIEWRREHPCEELTKKEFAGLLEVVISKSLRPQIIINGFKACGLFPWDPDSIDFSKCLGRKNIKQQSKPEIHDESTLSFRIFKDIIGPTKVDLFKNGDGNFDGSDRILFNLWKEFEGKKEIDDQNVDSDSPKIILVGTRNNNTHESLGATDQLLVNSKFDLDAVIIGDNLDDNVHQENLPIDKIGCDTNFDLKYIESDGDPLRNISQMEILSAPIIIEQDGRWQEVVINQPSEILKKNPVQEDLSYSDQDLKKKTLDQYLHYPNTPQRKGKRTSERDPFILSSSSWKKMNDDKELKKKIQLDEKENRKKERERKKIAREKEALEKRTKRKLKEKNGVKKIKLDLGPNQSINHILQLSETQEDNIKQKEDNTIFSTVNDKNLKTILYNNGSTVANQSQKEEKVKIISQISTNEKEKVQHVTKQLYFGGQIGEYNELVNKAGDHLDENLPLFSQNNVYCGICYSCTENITALKFGVRCDSCTRTYHDNCIQKHKLHKPNSLIFTCCTCLKRYKVL